MKPLNDYVIVKDVDKDELLKTKSGIFVANTNNDMPETHIAVVEAVSPDHEKDLKKGDKILYKHFRNMKFKEYECIEFKDIIVKL